MVWVKLSSEALGTAWYIIEAQWMDTDAIFYGYIVGWDEERTYFNQSDLELLSAQDGVPIAEGHGPGRRAVARRIGEDDGVQGHFPINYHGRLRLRKFSKSFPHCLTGN